MHHYQDLIIIFNRCFSDSHNTRLVKGDDEPVYLPANELCSFHSIVFAHGFFSSALHECSHWLIAGAERRKQVDFGYWYVPDGRNAKQQQIFQQVEIKPQAMEWVLSVACGHRFRVSVDNLNGEDTDDGDFKRAVYQQVKKYCEDGLSERAVTLHKALCEFYETSDILKLEYFDIETL